MNKLLDWFFKPPVDGPAAIILLRLMAGSVFLWEGVLKFVFPNQGVGRFTKLGFPFPGPTADLVLLVNNTSTVVPAEIAEQLTATHPDWMRDPARPLPSGAVSDI